MLLNKYQSTVLKKITDYKNTSADNSRQYVVCCNVIVILKVQLVILKRLSVFDINFYMKFKFYISSKFFAIYLLFCRSLFNTF